MGELEIGKRREVEGGQKEMELDWKPPSGGVEGDEPAKRRGNQCRRKRPGREEDYSRVARLDRKAMADSGF